MIVNERPSRRWGLSAWNLCFLILGGLAAAQTVAPTPEQLQIFQGLTPEQQQAVLQQITGGNGGNAGYGATPNPGQRPGLLEQQQMLEQLRRQQKPSGEEGEPETGTAQLRGQDWVIVEIDYYLPPRPVSPYLQALLSAQAAGKAPLVVPNSQIPTTAAAALAAAATAPTPNAPPIELSDADKARLDALMTLVRSKNPYQLSRDGALTLPGFPPIALLGLSEEQASLRLKAEPAFRGVDIRLTRLPITKTGVAGLKPFGYDLFEQAPWTFAPVTNVPVPSDYIVGPDDELDIQLYGNQNRSLRLFVGRDGRINLPEIGPVTVGGQSFNAVKALIEARVQRQMIGVRASVSMGETRSIRVFVLGEARHPGSYTISGLGTITSSLYAAGGVQRAGSLRNIQLKRRGALVRQLDLYDLLIRGDTTDDAKLLPGDVIFIPSVGPTVSVYGEVHRPAIYETKGESTVADVVNLAGGLTPEADRSKIMLTRIDPSEHRVVLSVDLGAGARTEAVRNGDELQVMSLRPTLDSAILVQGHVYTPGTFAYHQGIHLTDVIPSVDELMPDADIHYLLIRRELPPDRRISVLSADLAAALRNPGSKADIALMPRDRITVFDLSTSRDQVIEPVIDELRLQGNSGQPTELVDVVGRVKVPGEYPLEPGMRVSDLIRAGGGASDEAYHNAAELTRYTVVGGSRRTELIEVNLAAAMKGDPTANVVLQPFDSLSVKEIPLWEAQESVTIRGEVRFPGQYSIRRGETLKSVIQRAGGLTDFAFPEGSVFTREALKKKEQEQLNMLADRMQRDLTILAIQSAGAGQSGGAAALSVGQGLLSQLRASKAVGRLVIDLPRLMRSPVGSSVDVILRGDDELRVPRFEQQVTVLGEVQNATAHLYNPRLSRDGYIALSGGVTRRADRKRIYVVRADGSVIAQEGNRWFEHTSRVQIKPGDTIVVPLNVEHIPALPFYQAVTQILYNVAIAVAAVHAL